jgi:tape measure domain-containing protein
MTVGQVIAKLGVDPKEYEKGLKKAEAQADKAGSKIGSIFKNAFSVTLGMAMFDALKKGFKATISTAIDFNSMLQTAQIGFATLLGSAEKAQKFLDSLADFAAKTPFEFPELLDASKRMLAYGFAAGEVLPTLRAVGDAAAALGVGNEGIDRITLALGQIRARGKLASQEMLQLTEVGVPAWDILADAMGKTVPELQKMVSKGLIPGYKAVEMLTAGMTQRFGGMMASMENTWQGVTSSIKDIWRMTVGTLTQNLFGGLNAMLIKVRDFLSQFYSMLNAVMGKKSEQATDGLVQSTEDQAAAMTDVGDAAEEAAKKANKNLQAFDEVHQLQEDMSDTAAEDMFAMPETGTMAPLEMEDAGEPETVTKMQQMLEKLAVLFDPAIDGFKRLKEAAGTVISNIGDGLKWFYDNILTPFGTWVIAEAVPSFFDLLSGALMILNPVLEAFKSLGQWLWDNFLQPIAAWSGQAFIDAMNFVTQAFRDLGDWMSQNKDMVISGLAGILAGILAYQLITKIPTIISSIGTALSGLGAAFGFLTSPIGLIIAAIALLVAGFVYFYKTNEGFRGVVDSILKAIANAAIFLWENALKPLGEFLATVFVPLFADILVWSMQEFANTLENVTNTANSLWNSVWRPALEILKTSFVNAISSIGQSLQGLLNNTIKPFIDYILNSFILPIAAAIIDTLVPIFTDILVAAFEQFADSFAWAVNLVNDVYATVLKPVFELIKNIVLDTFEIIKGLWDKYGQTLLTNIKEFIQGVQDTAQLLWDKVLKPIIQPFLEMLSWLWEKHLKGLVQQVGEFVMKLVNGALEIYNKFIKPIIDWVIEKFGPAFAATFAFVIDVVGSIVAVFVDIAKSLFEILGGIIDFIVGIFTGNWKKAWEGIKQIFKGVFDSLWGIVKFPLNLIIDGLNIFIRGLNKLSFDIPDWVPLIGGKSFGINIPLIPKLAQGTNFVPQDMFAYLHEGEAVVPKKYNPAAAGLTAETIEQAVYRAFMNALRFMQASARQDDKELVLKIDNTTLARMQLPAIIREGQRQGLNLVVQPQGV